MLRLGLCCQFWEQPIKFRKTTAKFLKTLSADEDRKKLADLCRHNASSLLASLQFCARNQIGDFRVSSQILPLKTHPEVGYELSELPGGQEIREIFESCRRFARQHNLRQTFHPDQFVVLSTPHEKVLHGSIRELEYQAEAAQWIGADVVNVHGGGAYGNKQDSLDRLKKNFEKLSPRVRERLTLENDDRVYTPLDLLPVCRDLGIPFVYDVHHHRCLPDKLSIEEATDQAIETWNREPLFHLSSPRRGWDSTNPRLHEDEIAIRDFPENWLELDVTVEVEAKAKERAIFRLREALKKKAPALSFR